MKPICCMLVLLLGLQLSGCVTYSNNQLADPRPWPLEQPAEKKSAYLKLQTEYLFNGNPGKGGFNVPHLEKLLIREYKDSQAFDQVTTNRQAADVYVKVTVRNHEKGSLPLAFLSGFSLTVIPGTYDNELTMETRFLDAEGNDLGQIVKRETTTTWVQLLLIFALPFSESTDPTLSRLVRSTLEEAARRKLI